MSETGQHVFSVWLVPCEKHAQALLKTIRLLARRFDAPVFYPHVTLTTGLSDDFDHLRASVNEAITWSGPFSLNTSGLNCSEEFFKTLFITFMPSQSLTDLHRALSRHIEKRDGYEFRPHLSLLYSSMPLKQKQHLATDTFIGLDTILFDSIWVTTPGSGQERWDDVRRWATVHTALLGPNER